MPYAGPRHAGRNSPPGSLLGSLPVSLPSTHSTSNPVRTSSPSSAANAAARRAKLRWQPGCSSPSWVYRSTGAHAQPGCAASRASRSRSGYSRRSPSGPPAIRPIVALSSTQNVSNTGDIPTPQAAACGNRLAGTALTLVTPALST